ncbi:MAG TPA: Rieske 2Fe-2S domain-containing protein [Acidimicrobiales bacterium]
MRERPTELWSDGRVDRRAYLSAEVYRAELDRVFGRVWVYVAHESQLPAPGDYRSAFIGRSPVIVVRGDDGEVRVLHNRCSHRGATVCQGIGGTASVFRCAYHGWTYRNDGSLAGITYPDGYSEVDGAGLSEGLAIVPRVDSYRGFVFASLASTGPTLLEHLGEVAPYVDLRIDAGPEGLSLRSGQQRYSYAFNWKIQCENVVDGYHANFVHQSALSVLGKRPDGKLSTKIFKLANGDSPSRAVGLPGGHSVLDQRPTLGETAVKVARHRPGGEEYWQRMVDVHGPDRAHEAVAAGSGEGLNVFVFPNLAFVSQQIRVIHPVAVDRTHVDLFPTWLDGAPDELNTDRLRMHELTYGPAGLIGPDDLEMFERVALGIQGDGAAVDLRRGRASSPPDDDGVVVGQFTTEAPQRAFWDGWSVAMAEATA